MITFTEIKETLKAHPGEKIFWCSRESLDRAFEIMHPAHRIINKALYDKGISNLVFYIKKHKPQILACGE